MMLTRTWDALELESEHFNAPVTIRNAFNADLFSEVDVESLIGGANGIAPRRLRTFIDGSINPNAASAVRERPPVRGEGLESWTRRLFGAARFGLVANFVLGQDLPFSQATVNVLH